MAATAGTKNLLENPFRGETQRGDATKEARLGAAQPGELGRPERGAQHATGALLNRPFIESFP
jgi:hypothetical protein